MSLSKGQYVGLFVACLWAGGLLVAGIYGLIQDNSRWTWGMGDQVIDYTVSYVWMIDEKKFETYTVPANELTKNGIDYLAPEQEHRLTSKFGTLTSILDAYVTHIATKQTIYRPRISIGAGALLSYHINGEERERFYTIEHITNE